MRDNVNLSNSLSHAGDRNKAIKACYKALETEPLDPDANYQAGRILLPHDRIGALKHFQIAGTRIPDAPSLLLATGQTYLQSGNRTEAQKLLQDLLNLDEIMNLWPKRDTWATAHILLAQIEPEKASDHWEQAWSIDPRTTAEAAFTQSRELDRVLKTFQSEAAQKPWDWYSQANLGMILLKQERLLQAVESLKRATRLAPEKEGLSFQLACALYRSGQTQQALQILDRLAGELPASGLLNQVNQMRYQIRADK